MKPIETPDLVTPNRDKWIAWHAKRMAMMKSLLEPEGAGAVAAFDGEAFRAEMAAKLRCIPPATAEATRANDFATVIAPRLREMGWDGRYVRDALLAGSDPRAAIQREKLATLQQVLGGVGAIMAMVGPRGTGKTTIAAALAADRLWEDWAAIQADRKARWRTALYRKTTDIVARLKARYGDWGTTAPERLEELRAALIKFDLLIIDEWHEAADEKDVSRLKDRILTDLIDARYAARHDTLIISNQTYEGFTEATNPSIISRLNEHGGIMCCEWESFRERPAQI